ncbi:hypothetical protein SAMN06264364_1187 [Quadrisphaera granulorum]|uniref:Uncharacterized protein n=1 Tax=Quadrisphaera granulorum TaxID=317664 RepID=A0A316A3T2_9ACTN|nr:hypothetical protein BXY45_1187 [Quadrisphaera granulorum]SZE97458.1 hypothetical protein SAMN06264364_1187 [Quadrisphaera granulorum]
MSNRDVSKKTSAQFEKRSHLRRMTISSADAP